MNDPEGILEEFTAFAPFAASGLDRWRFSGGVRTFTPREYRYDERHAAKKSQTEKSKKDARRAAGICPDCPSDFVPVAPGRKRCAACLAKAVESNRRYRSARRPSG